MGEIEDLQERLNLLRENKKKDQEIKRLKKQIKQEEFAQTKTGKIFNKIADVGDKLTKPKPKSKGSPQKKKKKEKVPTVQEMMDKLPQ